MKPILAAVDGSGASLRALTRAAKLSIQLRVGLHVLIVQHTEADQRDIPAPLEPSEIKEIMARARDLASKAGVFTVDFTVETAGNPAFKIVDVAAAQNADLIVMGASGKSGFKTSFLGSTSKQVMKKSACPVSIVH